MHDSPDANDRLDKRPDQHDLEKRVAALEQRVHALEHPLAAQWPYPSAEPAQPVAAATPLAQPESTFSVLGKALLGIAGAYVLRAVEETSALPRPVIAWAGIAYAFLWLAWAARQRKGPPFASSIYAGTSALILAPMLWELTLRFKVLPAGMAAGVLCAYALAALALAAFARAGSAPGSEPRNLTPVVRVACVAAAALALALAIATHALLPFIVVLLFLAAVCAFVPGCNSAPEVQALIALSADAAIWIMIYIYFAQTPGREDYPELGKAVLLAPGVAMFLLYGVSVSLKTLLQQKEITIFETVQTTIAFLLAAASLADFEPAHSAVILGVGCLALSAASYAALFMAFVRAPTRRDSATFAGLRNTRVFLAWAAALLLAGSFLSVPPLAATVLLGATAIAATSVGGRKNWLAFRVYGTIFLVAAASASGLLSFLLAALVGMPAGAPALGVWLISSCAVLCYMAMKPGQRDSWLAQTLDLGFAALAAGAVAALAVKGLMGLTALAVAPGAHHLAFIRTLTLCATALALVFGGAHWRRLELTRLGYAALALVAIKLVTEDLRYGHLGYIAASIFLVALTLIAAPRVARTRQKA